MLSSGMSLLRANNSLPTLFYSSGFDSLYLLAEERVMYAIVDIETTGGHAGANGITEIAIFIYDGHNIVQQYETLVNPGVPIPRYIQSLTGITDEMTATAPAFGDVAMEVYNLLHDKIF